MLSLASEARIRRLLGLDIHRTFGEVVIWENGLTRHEGRVEMTRTALEGFGRQLLKTDEAMIEATGNCMAVSRVLTPYVARLVIANPLQVKAIAQGSQAPGGVLLAERGCEWADWTQVTGPADLPSRIRDCDVYSGLLACHLSRVYATYTYVISANFLS